MTEAVPRKLSEAQMQRRLQRGEQQRVETRRKLIEAAFDLFAEQGREAPSVDDVIAHAKVARGSFYNHFSSREELFDAVANGIGSSLHQLVLPHVEDVTDPAERISRSFRIFLRQFTAHASRGWVLLRTFPTAHQIDNDSELFFETALCEGMSTGRLRNQDRTMCIDIVLGLSVSAIRRILIEGKGADYIDNVTFGAMRFLGLDDGEAHRLAFAPLDLVDPI